MEWSDIGSWLGFAVLGFVALATFAWHMNELFVRPYLLPVEHILALASEMYQRNPEDPAEAAFIEEDAAWYRSETYEQGIWRRVRKHIIKELEKTHGG